MCTKKKSELKTVSTLLYNQFTFQIIDLCFQQAFPALIPSSPLLLDKYINQPKTINLSTLRFADKPVLMDLHVQSRFRSVCPFGSNLCISATSGYSATYNTTGDLWLICSLTNHLNIRIDSFGIRKT